MAGIAGKTPHLPAVTLVDVDKLFLVVIVCVFIEVVAGLLMWKTCTLTRTEAELALQRQTLKTCITKTDYTSTFVENSKLRRQLLKVEKEAEKIQAGKERKFKSATKTVRVARVGVYGSMVLLMWGTPLISFSPDYLWPSTFSHALSGGRESGSVGALSIVAMFIFGLAPTFSPVA
eukprot:jgi/Undpi1/10323/HiC_scaffold_28.g12774.m1